MIEGPSEPGEPYTSWEAALKRAHEVLDGDPSIERVMLVAADRPLGHALPKLEGGTYNLEVAFTDPNAWHIVTRSEGLDEKSLEEAVIQLEGFWS